MVVCVVDDLLFSVKISTAAKALGTEIYFARAADQVMADIREKQPTLVILDLNSSKLQPMAVIGALQADPNLTGITTLGFVSHVDAETIALARAAGINEVLARLAFVARLGEILTR